MSEQSKRLLQGGARVATGVVIIGVSVGVAAVLGSGLVDVPAVERGVVAVTADTSQDAEFSLVCTGAFGELGADPSKPTASVPSGSTQLTLVGEVLEQRELARELSQGTSPLVLDTAASEVVGAAELQQVSTSTLQGLAASSCVEPAHEQWLVGGGTQLGQSSTIVLGNPFSVPATVQFTIFDENGPIDSSQTTGVLVPAGSQRIVSLNGYAPAAAALAVKVESTGAAVSAALSVSETVDIRSFSVDTVTRQLAASTQLVVPAVMNFSDHSHAPVDGVSEDGDFPVEVRLLAPGEAAGTATVRALGADGKSQDLGTIDVEPGVVATLEVASWPDTAEAIMIDSEVPVVGGVLGSADVTPAHDNSWFAPAPTLPADTDVAVPVVAAGELVLANPGDTDAVVTLTPFVSDSAESSADSAPATGAEIEVTVPAGGAIVTKAQGANWLHTTAPISAGVRVSSGAYLASYPVLAPIERSTTLTVYPR